jgi:hypothetical protein
MKTAILLFTLLVSNQTSFAQTRYSDADRAMPSLLTVAGKGLTDKVSGDSIALACIGEQPNPCRAVQFFAIINKKFSWIGRKKILLTESEIQSINNNEAGLDQIESEKLKAHLKKVQKQAQQNVRATAWKWIIPATTWPASIAGGISLFVGGAPIIGILIPFATWLALGKLVVQQNNQDLVGRVSAGKQVSEKITLKDGWNWSSNPKPLKSRIFESYLCTIQFYLEGNETLSVMNDLNEICNRHETRTQTQ